MYYNYILMVHYLIGQAMKGTLNNCNFVFKDVASAMRLKTCAADLSCIKKQIDTAYVLRCEKLTS